MSILEVILWGKLVGVLVWYESSKTSSFEYAPGFLKDGLEPSPLMAPLSSKIITANLNNNQNLGFDTDKGLPLFISDSLPDKFGTDLFAKYLEKEGKTYNQLTPLEKLAYIGNRGMGALEFQPAKHGQINTKHLNLKNLNDISKSLLNNEPIGNINGMMNLFLVGTSPGGAQPKVLINIDNTSGDIFRGDIMPTENQESWIVKFNRDTGDELFDKEKGKIEYAYYLMAKAAKINVMHSELKEVEGEHFFMTKRFDRQQGEKIHTQTLHALAGMHFKSPNTYSYEQVFSVLNNMRLDYLAKEQIFRIMVFNVMSRNVDDHTKNIGFNMDKNGNWQLSPAYDLTFSYNEHYNRETPHFLSINGKNEKIKLEDILHVASEYSIKNPKKIINQVNTSLLQWKTIASELNIPQNTIDYIASKMNTFPFRLKSM